MYGWNDCWAALCACILNPRLSTPELGFFAVQEFTGDPRKETAQTKIDAEKNPLDILGLCRGPGKDGIYPETIRTLREEGYTWVEVAKILYPGRPEKEYDQLKHRVYARLRHYRKKNKEQRTGGVPWKSR